LYLAKTSSPLPPPWPGLKKRRRAAIPRSRRASSHIKMLFELMNRTVASNETKTLWHVSQVPWSPDPDVVNFIWCSRRRGMLPPAVIHAPDCKTTKTTIAADRTTTHEGANHRPPDRNLVGSRDLRDDWATCPPNATGWNDANMEAEQEQIISTWRLLLHGNNTSRKY
jgi:hypothetical protein